MKIFLFCTCLLLYISPNAFAQSTAYFTFNQNYTINKIIKTKTDEHFSIASNAYGKAVIKFDAVFNTIWYKQISNLGNATILDIAETNNGNFVILTNNVDSSFMYKFSSTGALLHRKYFTSITINNFTPTNLTHSITGDGILLSGGYCNVENYLIRLDDNLNTIWKYQYRDGTGTCANSRASDIVTEANKYTFASNPSSGGINIVSINDSGNVVSAKNFALSLIVGGYPLQLIQLQNGAYIATWASADISKGKQFICIDSSNTNAIVRGYNLGYFYYLNDYIEYQTNKIMIGGTNITAINNNQTNVLLAINNTGIVQWCKKSESVANAASPSQINTFCKSLDNQSVFTFGGSGLDGAYGAKLSTMGDGFCNSITATATIQSSDSNTATARTLVKLNLTALITGNVSASIVDSTCSKTILCGVLNNAPLQINDNNMNPNFLHPNPCRDVLHLPIAKNINSSTINIYNMLGTKMIVQIKNNLPNEIQISVQELPIGYYIMLVNDGEKMGRYYFWKD